MPKPSLALLLALTGLAACSSTDNTKPASTTTTATVSTTVAFTTTTAPTTAAATTTTQAVSTTAPTTVPAATTTNAPAAGQPDWKAIVEALGRTRQSIYTKPDPSRVGEVCATGSPCSTALSAQITDLANKGWHVEGATPYTVVDVKLEKFDGATLDASVVVSLTVTVQRENAKANIVDASGAVVAALVPQVPTGQNERGLKLLARAAGDTWRFVQEDEPKGVPA